MPSLPGVMLNTVDKEFKTTANSIANLSYNLLGYLPAPTVYGLIYDAGDGGNARQALEASAFDAEPIAAAGAHGRPTGHSAIRHRRNRSRGRVRRGARTAAKRASSRPCIATSARPWARRQPPRRGRG